jgi:DNA primase
VVVLDADAAGRKAAMRGELLIGEKACRWSCRAAAGEDPDSRS